MNFWTSQRISEVRNEVRNITVKSYLKSTVIDNIFFNSVSHPTISGNLVYDLTDHLPNFLIVNKFTTLPKGFKLLKRDYSNFNEQHFLQDIKSINWKLESSNNNVNKMFDTFNSELMKIVDKHTPLRQLSRKEIKYKSKPWITHGNIGGL